AVCSNQFPSPGASTNEKGAVAVHIRLNACFRPVRRCYTRTLAEVHPSKAIVLKRESKMHIVEHSVKEGNQKCMPGAVLKRVVACGVGVVIQIAVDKLRLRHRGSKDKSRTFYVNSAAVSHNAKSHNAKRCFIEFAHCL